MMRERHVTDVMERFDAMAPAYDVLEPYYEHFYERVHALLDRALAPPPGARNLRALDAGCGHGFQAKILRGLGYKTHGADLAGALVALARHRVPGAWFARGDVTALPYREAAFDAVSCCGSTLSFVDDPDLALRELARVLRPGGRLFLDCEHKWSPDLAWTAVCALTGGRLGYQVSARALWRALRRPLRAPIALPYPGYGTLTFFTRPDLRARLEAAGLRVERTWGIHAITNVVPSTVLHRERVSRPLSVVYRVLRALDTALAPAAVANSLVVLAVKRR